jgi:hypothetical protein
MKLLHTWIDKIKSDFQYGPIASIFSFFQGRATTFAIFFTVVGTYLAVHGKLDGNYALFVTAIQGLVFAHSCKEDWARKQDQQSTVVNNIEVQK